MRGDVTGEQVAARWGLAANTAPLETAALGKNNKKKMPRDPTAEPEQRRVPGLAPCPTLEGLRAPDGADPLPSPPSSLLTSFLPIPKDEDSWGKILEYFNKEETDGSHLAG